MKDVESRAFAVQRKWPLLVIAAVAIGAGVVFLARPLLTKSSYVEPAARAETVVESMPEKAIPNKGAQRRSVGNRPAAWGGGYSVPDENFEQGEIRC